MLIITAADQVLAVSTVKDHNQGPVVQSIVSLKNLLITNSLIVVAKIFSNTLIFLLEKMRVVLQCKSSLHFFSAKNVFSIFQDRNFNDT